MKGPIFNAKDLTVNQPAGELPQMQEALMDMFQPMTFILIRKEVVNFKLEETRKPICFEGNWQPAGWRLVIDQIGQRKWKFYSVWATLPLLLEPDEIIEYMGTKYRVMAVDDYINYGYRKYDLTESYK